ncbi:nuclear hormone receptor HR96-like isoform X2 [Daphnia pulex]|nr:nuclear hormone receptor HR96-like isoform X2 [Daphnia pulex]
MEEYVSLTSPNTPVSPLSNACTSPGELHASMSGKVCGVCGDKALGCNFGATTCESCKAFFRRNALKGKEFRCPFENNCKIDAVTRRFCQKCRLKKCLDIGMKKEFIMSEEERTVKRRKIEENRMKKTKPGRTNNTKINSKQLIHLLNGGGSRANQRKSDIKSEAESSFSDSDVTTSPLDNSSEGFHESPASSNKATITVISNHQQLTPENRGRMLEMSPPEDCPSDSSPSTANGGMRSQSMSVADAFNINLQTMDALLNTAISAEYNVVVDLVRGNDTSPLSPVRDRQLNELEMAKLQELVVANKALLAPLTEERPVDLHYDSGDPTLLNVINLTDIAIRRIIKMAKKLAAFKTLCQEDQIALLKGGCTELMILRSVMSYDADKGCWKIPHTDSHMNHIKVEVLKEAQGNLYEEHQRYIQSFDPLWRSDEHIMLLLSAITLFDPNRPHVIHRDAIKLEQESYYYLLRRYLESVVGGCKARSMFLKLIAKISELHILNDNHVRVYLDLNPKEVEPLLIEIFDLKSR